jgi:AcrR family transcriptional regulator
MPAATLTHLKEKEREDRRQIILSAARRLFAGKDFRRVTVREIAREAGVSIGTIYNYYDNLDTLFLDVFFAGARELTELIDTRFNENPSFPLKRFCEVYIGFLNDHMTFYQMMSHFMLGGNLSPEAVEMLNPTMRELMNRIERIVAASGLTRKTRITAHALFSALNGVMISYARYPGRSLDDIRRHTMRLACFIGEQFSGSK